MNVRTQNTAPTALPPITAGGSNTEPFDGYSAFAKLDDAPSNDQEEATDENSDQGKEAVEDTVDEIKEDDLEDDTDEQGDDPEEDTADENEDTDEDVNEVEISDDTLIEVKVNGQVDQVPIKDLRRLAGQEKALTRKSMAVAAQAEKAKAQEQFAETRLNKAKEKAETRYKQYEQIDFVALAQSGNYSSEDIERYREAAKEAKAELDYFNEELETFYKETQEARQKDLVEQGKQALEQFEDPASLFYIEDFRDRYNDLASHAQSLGITPDKLNTTPDPWFWKLLDDSLRRGTAKKTLTTATNKEAKAKRIKKPSSSKTVLKSRKSKRQEQRGLSADRRKEEAMAKLRKSGSKGDALAAFAALD